MIAAVELARAQQLEQLGGEVLLQHERHLRHALDRLANELGQQVRADRVDHAERERAAERILPALGGLLDLRRLLDHRLRLAHDLLADRRHAHLVGAALEDAHVELFLELLDRHRQRRLRDEARLGGAPEVLLARDRDDVAKLGERHPSPDHVAGLSLSAFMLSMQLLAHRRVQVDPLGRDRRLEPLLVERLELAALHHRRERVVDQLLERRVVLPAP